MNPKYKLIVIGGSAGSLQVILRVLKEFPGDFSIPFLLVLHRNNEFESALAQLIDAKTDLCVKEVEEKETIKQGIVYVCPADYHVLIEKNGTFSLDYSEKINFSRPSIDVVFTSAADAYGDQLVCILLSGANADGAEGLRFAHEKGSLIIVQQPEDAKVSYMPEQALLRVAPDMILPGKEIAPFIKSLV